MIESPAKHFKVVTSVAYLEHHQQASVHGYQLNQSRFFMKPEKRGKVGLEFVGLKKRVCSDRLSNFPAALVGLQSVKAENVREFDGLFQSILDVETKQQKLAQPNHVACDAVMRSAGSNPSQYVHAGNTKLGLALFIEPFDSAAQ